MPYAPQNENIYLAAFAGAIAGMAAAHRKMTTVFSTTLYSGLAEVADSFAQEVDTQVGSNIGTTDNQFAGEIVQEVCYGYWSDRSPPDTSTFTTAGTWLDAANGVSSIIIAALVQLASQGLIGNTTAMSVVKQIRSTTVDPPGFGVITQGDVKKLVASVPITTKLGDTLRITGNVSGNGGVHDGSVVLSLEIGGASVGQGEVAASLVSWVAADDVSRNIMVSVDVDPNVVGANTVDMYIIISAGAAGTTFTDAEKDVLNVIAYQNISP